MGLTVKDKSGGVSVQKPKLISPEIEELYPKIENIRSASIT